MFLQRQGFHSDRLHMDWFGHLDANPDEVHLDPHNFLHSCVSLQVHQLGRWLQKLCSLQFRVQDSNQSHQRAQPRVSLPSQVYQVPHQVICYQLTFVRKPLIVFRNVELLYFLTGSEPNFGKISYNYVTFNTKSSHYDLKNISLGSWI